MQWLGMRVRSRTARTSCCCETAATTPLVLATSTEVGSMSGVTTIDTGARSAVTAATGRNAGRTESAGGVATVGRGRRAHCRENRDRARLVRWSDVAADRKPLHPGTREQLKAAPDRLPDALDGHHPEAVVKRRALHPLLLENVRKGPPAPKVELVEEAYVAKEEGRGAGVVPVGLGEPVVVLGQEEREIVLLGDGPGLEDAVREAVGVLTARTVDARDGCVGLAARVGGVCITKREHAFQVRRSDTEGVRSDTEGIAVQGTTEADWPGLGLQHVWGGMPREVMAVRCKW